MKRHALIASMMLTACGPLTLQQAESQCLEQARLAAQPRGEIGLGVGSDGPGGFANITVSSDYLLGRDPSAVFDLCVLDKSGLPPSQPLYSRTDWKG